MSIKPINGPSHVLVRIEHRNRCGTGVRRVEFEDSDEKGIAEMCSPSWGVRWALGMLNEGDDQKTVVDLFEAVMECDPGFFEPGSYYEKNSEHHKEGKLLVEAFDAIIKWHNYRLGQAEKLKKNRHRITSLDQVPASVSSTRPCQSSPSCSRSRPGYPPSTAASDSHP